ncbi:Predicted DNA-binding transcriptional regulator YafY, contains an HTH and WYL domains [Anaerovirgula multivorans]|uniref:Predicted DNA-binding transcriptional regulator YafY, contains an HTH and WYL domains n=1 Tax=Anaerovirgula multivorans TaxID=312168 RepID=A0A239IGB8_9FIRM|nr:YafY family protein [Anaerovirgula multivorans]SNS92615.1 Predicted DNA-binding transcriptional regulator YafY, contains an HTH and WYL domains [Anaerovirgula multivorans]
MAGNRLFQMVYLLLEKGSITAPQLASYFEVSVRTIYRDIDILSAAGIPVYTTPGKGGGISLQENFVLNKSLISEGEQEQILMALQGICIVDAENTNALLAKLSSVFQKKNVNWIEVDFSDWVKNEANESVFNTLKSAIFQNKKVSFLYFSGKGESINRLVEPLKLVFKSKDWFLYGYCCLRENNRLFKLTRIKELELTSESFTRFVAPQIFEGVEKISEKIIPVTLAFDKEMSFRVYDEFADGVTCNDDGSFLVKTHLPHNERLFSYLFSFGDKVEVIAPQSIRDELQIRLKKIQDKYIT